MSNSLSDAFVVALASHDNAPTADIPAPKKPRRAPKPKPGAAIKPKAVAKAKAKAKAKAEPKLNQEQRDMLATDRQLAAARKAIAALEAAAPDGSNAPIWHLAANKFLADLEKEDCSSRVMALLFNDLFQHRMTGELYGHMHWKQIDKSNSQYCEQGKVLWNDICEARKELLAMWSKRRPHLTKKQMEMPWSRLKAAAFDAWPKPEGYGANPNDGKTSMEKAKAPLQKIYLSLCNDDTNVKAKTDVIKMLGAALLRLGVDLAAVNEKITK